MEDLGSPGFPGLGRSLVHADVSVAGGYSPLK